MQTDILAILIRFRSARYSIFGDVSKMFLNCDIATEKDKNFLRFLYKDPTDKKAPLKIYRFTTLVFGVTDSPFQILTCFKKLVQMKLDDPKVTEIDKKACNVILRDFYIDDCSYASNSEQEAIEIRQALTNILAEGSFHIRKWVSNSPKVLASIPEKAAL